MYANVNCVSDTASVQQSWTGTTYGTRMFRAESDGNGMDSVENSCSTCCRGGCYTALGTTTCAEGYTKAYDGRVGGVEAHDGGQYYGKTLCVDGSAGAHYNWPSGYWMRLMRHRDSSSSNSDGMDQVTNTCAVCCK